MTERYRYNVAIDMSITSYKSTTLASASDAGLDYTNNCPQYPKGSIKLFTKNKNKETFVILSLLSLLSCQREDEKFSITAVIIVW